MKFAAVIFTYNRPDMLQQTSGHMMALIDDVLVLDDGSPYNISGGQVMQFKHGGKKMFWRQFDRAFKWCKKQDADYFIFMPDDFLDLDLERVKGLIPTLPTPFAYNLINDGRDVCWVNKRPRPHGKESIRIGFCDGGFFCDRKVLELLDWEFPPIPEAWFNTPTKSSGIGWMLTQLLNSHNVAIFKPVKSLAYHGDHDSQMHPNERKKNPLISK